MKRDFKPKRILALLVALVMVVTAMPILSVAAAPGEDANFVLRFPVPVAGDENLDSYQNMPMLSEGGEYTATISVRTTPANAGQVDVRLAYTWGQDAATDWVTVTDEWQTLTLNFTSYGGWIPLRINVQPERNTNTAPVHFYVGHITVVGADGVAYASGPDFTWDNGGSAHAEIVPYGFAYTPGLGGSLLALRINVDGDAGNSYSNLAHFEVGGEYTVFASVISTSGNVSARLAYSWTEDWASAWQPVTAEWQTLQLDFVFQGDWTPLRINGTGNGYFYVAQIIIVDANDEVVFDTGADFGWYNGGDADAEIVPYGAPGPRGNRALRVDAEFDAAVWFQDGYDFPAGTYRMSAWARGDGAINIIMPLADWGLWDYRFYGFETTGDEFEWTFIQTEPAAMIEGPHRLMLWCPSPGNTVFLTDFVLERLVGGEWEVAFDFTDVAAYRVSAGSPNYAADWLRDNVRWVPIAEANAWDGPEEEPEPIDPRVDRLGQMIAAAGNFATWVDPDSTDEELRAIREDDNAWLAQFSRPTTWDVWGGLEGTREQFGLTATGFFHIQNYTHPDGRVQSFMVNPLGNIYFNNAPNVIDTNESFTNVAGRFEEYVWLPLEGEERDRFAAAWHAGGDINFSFYGANWIRTRDEAFNLRNFAAGQSDRLWNLGFTGAGHWSENIPHPAFAGVDAPYFADFGQLRLPGNWWFPGAYRPGEDQTVFLIGGSYLWDVFHEGFRAEMFRNFNEDPTRLGPNLNRDNPQIIGFFMENERFYDHLRFEILGGGGAGSGTRNRLMQFLQEKYGTVEALNAAWNLNLDSWGAFNNGSISINTHATSVDMDEFYFIYFTELYSMTREVLNEVAPNHMLLGDRWHSRIMANSTLANILVEASAPYLDAMSFNYYAWDVNVEMIARLYELSGQTPFIMTEFHYGDRSTGLTFGVRAAANEQEKGSMYRNYVENLAYTGHVVGLNWFTWLDQPATGRFFEGHGGEAGALGFFTVLDRPYRTFLEYVTRTNFDIYDLVLRNRAPFRHTFLPGQVERDGDQHMEIPHIEGGFDIHNLSQPWVGAAHADLGPDNIVVGVLTQDVSVNFYLGWYDGHMYLRADIVDPTPMLNPAALTQNFGYVWGGDAVELFFGPENVAQGGGMQFGDIQALFGANHNNGAPITINSWYNRGSRYRPPLSPTAPGDGDSRLLFDIGTMMWADGNGYTMATRIPMAEITGRPLEAGELIRFDMGISAAVLPVGGRSHQLMWNGTDFNSSSRERWGTIEFVGGPTVARQPFVVYDGMAPVWSRSAGGNITMPFFLAPGDMGMLSLRAFADWSGGTPTWNAATNTATVSGIHNLTGELVTVSIQADSGAATVNGNAVNATMLLVDGRAYLPAEFMAQAFGYEVSRDGARLVIG